MEKPVVKIVCMIGALVFICWFTIPKEISFMEPCGDCQGAQHLLFGRTFVFQKATRHDLLVLPGVGPSLAGDLDQIKNHANISWKMLDRQVKGLGQKRLALLKTAMRLEK